MDITYKTALPLLSPDQAAPQARAAMEATQKSLGMVPNLTRAMANAPALLLSYQYGAVQLKKLTGFSTVEQAILNLTVSRHHGCDYCLRAHGTMAKNHQDVPLSILSAVQQGKPISDDPRLAALQRMIQIMLETSGNPPVEAVKRFHDAGYDDHALLDIILGIAVKTMSNYVNHLFGTPVDEAFAAGMA